MAAGAVAVAGSGAHSGPRRSRRRRLWYISPESFRDLRASCLLSRQACAEYLGVCLRTVRHWEAGRNRVPWSAVRLLRLLRCGELGGLHAAWDVWTLDRLGLHSPDGRTFRLDAMRTWWLQLEQARFWREAYNRGELGRRPERVERASTFLPATSEQAAPVRQETTAGRPTLGRDLLPPNAVAPGSCSAGSPAWPPARSAGGHAGLPTELDPFKTNGERNAGRGLGSNGTKNRDKVYLSIETI